MTIIKRSLSLLSISTALWIGYPAAAQSAPPTPNELAELQRLEPQRTLEAERYLMEGRSRSGLDERYTFKHVESITDSYGIYHGRFREYFNGIRVMGGNAIVHIDRNGRPLKPTLKFFNNITIPTTPAIPQADAINRAKAAFDPGGRMRDLETNDIELLIYVSLVQIDRGTPPSTEVVNLDYRRYEFIPGSFTLGWQVCIDSEEESRYYLIDAQSGVIVKQNDPSSHANAPGTGESYFHGPTKFTHKNVGGDRPFAMADPLRGKDGGNVFLNANRGTSNKASKYSAYRDDDGHWANGVRDDGTAITDSPEGQTAAVDAMYAVSKAWDFLGLYGRNGFDNAGTPVKARIHWREKEGVPYTDAKWKHHTFENRRGLFLGDGQTSTSLSTIAHELGHGLWFSRFGFMVWDNQIHKGLNEGQADIMGALTEFFSWKAGNENSKYTYMDGEWHWVSRMVDPEKYAKDQFNKDGYRYYVSGLEDEEEHIVGAILGHMFVFLAHGATNDQKSTLSSAYLPHGFSGLGVETAGHLWYRAMTAYYPEYGDFYDMRDAFLAAATSPFTPASHKDAVNAAFAGIGIGSMPHTGADGKTPAIHSMNVTVDERNGFALIDASVSDNYLMGRVEVYLDGNLAFTDYKIPYGGPVSLVGLPDGKHSIYIKAYDVLGFQTTSETKYFFLGGPERQLIKNGGFEWNGDWNFPSGNMISSSSDLAFAGQRYLRMAGDSNVWQVVNIPMTAQGTALRYRVRYEGHDNNGFQNQKLYVELRSASTGAIVKSLATHNEGDETFDNSPLTRTYKQVVLPVSEKGAYRLTFRVDGGTAHRFKIDNVRMTYTEPVAATVSAKVREEEDTVEFNLSLSGIEKEEIQTVKYYLDDAFEKGKAPLQGAGIDKWPSFRTIVSTKTMSAKTHAVVTVVYYLNNAVAVKAGTYFTVTRPSNLIKNGDFETGITHWQSSGPGFHLIEPVLDTTSPCYFGSRCAQLGRVGTANTSLLQQKFKITGTPIGGSLHFRLRVQTEEIGNANNDTFRIYFIDEEGKKVYPVGMVYSNVTKARNFPGNYNGYIPVDIPLPKELLHAGQVWVSFEAKENNSLKTWFYVDNVSLILDELDKKN